MKEELICTRNGSNNLTSQLLIRFDEVDTPVPNERAALTFLSGCAPKMPFVNDHVQATLNECIIAITGQS
jgi:hypothetical protein